MLQPDGFPGFVRALPKVAFPFSGACGWLLQGSDQQVVFLEIDEPIEVPEHLHEERWEPVLAGGVELNCGGTVKRYEAGESFFIPAGYKALIVFNSPSRYATKQ